MGALYHLKQKLVDFCNVIQENVSRTDTVPSSKVVYDLKADSDSQISDLNDSLTTMTSTAMSRYDTTSLAKNASRTLNSFADYGSVTINDAGLYVCISWTSGENAGGRSSSFYIGDGVNGLLSNNPQTFPSNEYKTQQIIQFVSVTSPVTITRRYFDTVATTEHHWEIRKLIAY